MVNGQQFKCRCENFDEIEDESRFMLGEEKNVQVEQEGQLRSM